VESRTESEKVMATQHEGKIKLGSFMPVSHS